jgi:sugar lactone lactonase YvrE
VSEHDDQGRLLSPALVWADGSGRRFRGRINAVAVSPDGSTVAAAEGYSIDGDDRGLVASVPQVAFFERADLGGDPVRAHLAPELLAAEMVPEALAFSPDGSTLFAAMFDRLVLVPSDPEEGETTELRDVELSESDQPDPARGISALALSADGDLVALGRRDGSASVIRLASAEPVAELRGGVGAVEALAFSPDGTRLLAVSDGEEQREPPADEEDEEDEELAEQVALVWSLASGQPTTEVRARLGYEVAFASDGTLLGSFPNDDGWLETLVLWDPWDPRGPTGLASFTAPVEISCMYLEQAGERLVTGDAEGRVTIWEFPEQASGTTPGGLG